MLALSNARAAFDALIETPGNPVPKAAHSALVMADDGVMLRAARWPAGQSPARGTVFVLQGRAETIEKYFETVGALIARGFAVLAFDWRGQGGSERLVRDRRKGHVDDFDHYLRDLSAIMRWAGQEAMPRPFFALAHSTGGAVLLLAAHRGATAFRRAILTAPLVRLHAVPRPPLAHALADGLDALGLGGRFPPFARQVDPLRQPFEGNLLTGDAGRFARNLGILSAEPRLVLGGPTVGWLRAAFAAMKAMQDDAFGAQSRMPMLFVLGGADRLVSSPAAAALAARMRAAGSVELPLARHEILMERDLVRAEFWAAFDAFIPGEDAAEPAMENGAVPMGSEPAARAPFSPPAS